MTWLGVVLLALFVGTQILYLLSMLVEGYFFTRPVNKVDLSRLDEVAPADCPHIVLFYPVLRELEGTMRTTFAALAKLDYPADRYSIVAIPNADDRATVASLQRLQHEFPRLEVMAVPPTSDPRWQCVWDAWRGNPNASWFPRGRGAGARDLPPKKTRQLVYAFYNMMATRPGGADCLISYIDADSLVPPNLFRAAAAGSRDYDVLQATNVAGNLLHTMAASWFAFDHLAWDANLYRHTTANGRQPFWVLGKGLFFRAADLLEYGGFHPWITIEDPEVGLRLWANGKRLGVIDAPLIEEVPETFAVGIKQRMRWVAGFFQTLDLPLRELNLSPGERLRAWLNFLPCLSLAANGIGIPIGVWALAAWGLGESPLPDWTTPLVIANLVCFAAVMAKIYAGAWRMAANVLSRRQRIWYMVRVNPISLILFWCLWIVPLWLGWRMYRKDSGLVWERTEKINANKDLLRSGIDRLGFE